MQGQKLEELLKTSDYVSQILDYLQKKLMRNQQQKINVEQDSIEYIENAIDLKMSLRSLADGIQTNRSLVQLQKQQIQKKKVFLEGLQYYKATLKNQIGHSKLDVISVKDYVQNPPTQETNWIQGYEQQQKKLQNTLQQFKQKENLYKQNEFKKQELKKQISTSQQKYKKAFPQQIKKLYTQVNQISKTYNIKEVDIVPQTQFKSNKIEQIYNLLYPLKINGLIDIKHLNQFQIQELEITIEKGFFEGYQYARKNGIMIQEKPIRFFIASIFKQSEYEKQQILAVSTSRRQDFTTEQVFSNLFKKQKVKLIYTNPESQAQRNINNKYSQLNWISQYLASSSNLINGNQFVDTIKNKVFSLYLIKYAIQNLCKKVPTYFNPLFKRGQQGFRHKTYPILQNKKLLFTKCEKTDFQTYKKDIFVPVWVQKALNNYSILMQMKKYPNSNEGSKFMYQTQNDDQLKLLNNFIEQNNLEELLETNFYSYYKFQLLAQKNILSGYFLVPSSYPKRQSVVRLINLKRASNDSQNKLLKNKTVGTIKQTKLVIIQDNSSSTSKSFTQQLNSMQKQLNKQVKFFIVGKNSPSDEICKKRFQFWIYFQINRLLSLMIEDSLEKMIDY